MGGHFDFSNKQEKLNALTTQINSSTFWDQNNKDNLLKEYQELKKTVDSIQKIDNIIVNNQELLNLLLIDYQSDLYNIVLNDYTTLINEINSLKLLTYLNGPYDHANAILEIHSGAGGTESCDWVDMLKRMYQRYLEKKGYEVSILDFEKGEEVGYKSIALLVKRNNAYGYLKNEAGIHRLVRISPFDSNKRRHTSFASVEIIPELKEDVTVIINDSDLKIDVYRSSGNGGQGVNTTDSAVRITHLPTNIVVTCQNERSQIKNKEEALNILKGKLYQIEQEKKSSQLNSMKTNTSINFGYAKRSYVMCPYTLVKDNQTNTETSNVIAVIDGDIDLFITSGLKSNIN